MNGALDLQVNHGLCDIMNNCINCAFNSILVAIKKKDAFTRKVNPVISVKVANLLEVENLTLFLKVTKETIVDLERGPLVRVKGFKYLKVHTSESFTWTTHTTD